MNVLIVGSGGREHALAWKAAQSATATEIFVAPGNAGTSLEPGITNIDIAADNIDALLQFAQEKNIELTIVGPEVPLVAGIVDRFEHRRRSSKEFEVLAQRQIAVDGFDLGQRVEVASPPIQLDLNMRGDLKPGPKPTLCLTNALRYTTDLARVTSHQRNDAIGLAQFPGSKDHTHVAVETHAMASAHATPP